MTTLLRKELALLLLGVTQLVQAAPDYFRLEPGSVRLYRAQTSEAEFTIRVGKAGFVHNGHVHYPVNGYVEEPILAYRDENTGALYHLEDEQDVLLTSIEKGPGWFQANRRSCDQEGHAGEPLVPYVGPSGQFANALAIQYRAFGCADNGVASERYIENVGLVQRTIQTFAGPVIYDLVDARIGPMSVTESPNTNLSIAIHRAFGPTLIANLRWNAYGDATVLQMPTSQDFEVVLRDSKGKEVWRWSDGKFFTPQVRNISARHLRYEVEVPLQFYGILLHEGVYTVEAWLMTAQERQYATAISFKYTHPELPGSPKE